MRPPADADRDTIDFGRLWGMVRRRWLWPVLGALVGLAAGIAYLATTPPTYTAMARLLVDDPRSKILEEVTPAPAQQRTDATILSEIEILASTRLAERVARDLDLANDAAFMDPPRSMLAEALGTAIGGARGAVDGLRTAWSEPNEADGVELALLARDGATDAPTEAPGALAGAGDDGARLDPRLPDPRLEAAVARLQSGLVLQRAGRSYAIAVGFRASSPELARDITNAYVRAYLNDEADSGLAASRRATAWMEGQIGQLKEEAQDAAMAAERFRAENGLSTTGSNGQLATQQQLGELTSQLALARGETARASARYRQYQNLAARPLSEAVVQPLLREDGMPVSPALVDLRDAYRGIDARAREVTERFGADHVQAVALREQRENLERTIGEELARTGLALENALQAARAREEALENGIAEATQRSAAVGPAQVRLRELEQRAETLNSLSATFMERFAQVSQQQTYPVSKARLLSEASLPRSKSAPRSTLTLAFLVLMGGMAGAGLGALRELTDATVRSEDDVRRATGRPLLGFVPTISARARNEAGGNGGREATRMLASAGAPDSLLGDTLQNVRIAARSLREGGIVLGVTSMEPGEGKTTLAANLAAHLSSNGSRTLLVDGDLREASLSERLAPKAGKGIVDVLRGTPLDEALVAVPGTDLNVLPAITAGRVGHPAEWLSHERMEAMLDEGRRRFRFVILDLPSITDCADPRAVAPLLDGVVLIAEWGRTPQAVLRTQLAEEDAIRERLLGTILNRTDARRLHRYDTGGRGRMVRAHARRNPVRG